jgi:RES domain-containing protein
MKCFRLVDPNYSDITEVVLAGGATKYGGRWNPIGTRAIYLSTSETVTFAEKGFYSIIDRAYVLKIKSKSPRETKSLLVDVPFSLLNINLDIEATDILDLTDELEFSDCLKKASLPVLPVKDSRLSPYLGLPGKWTQQMGQYCANVKKVGIKVKSARNDQGDNIVLFPTNFKPTQLEVTQVTTVRLSAVDSRNDKKFSLKSSEVNLSKILVEGKADVLVDVLNFPLN